MVRGHSGAQDRHSGLAQAYGYAQDGHIHRRTSVIFESCLLHVSTLRTWPLA